MLQHVYQNRKLRQNVTQFDAYIAAPATGSLTLPASGRFCLVATSAAAEGTLAVTIVNSATTTISVHAMLVNDSIVIDNIQAFSQVTVQAGFDLLLDTGLGIYKKVIGGA